jgi:hypothetical protein
MRRSNSIITDYKGSHLAAKIDTHEIGKDSSFLSPKYVLYRIRIFTFYKSWTVKKRYSNFVELHYVLSKKLENLPELPPKRFFSLSEETIKERKTLFEKYLNYLFKNINVCTSPEILEFIEVEKDLLMLWMKSGTMVESSSSTAIKRYYSMIANKNSDTNIQNKARSIDDTDINTNYYVTLHDFKANMEINNNNNTDITDKSPNMTVIEEFLRNLEFKSDNKSEVIKTFEQYLKNDKIWPTFRKDEIQRLFYGDVNSGTNIVSSLMSDESESNSSSSKQPLKGLLFHMGNIEQNNLGSEYCLEFLCKLLDYEFNPECEIYIHILKYSKIEYLLDMNLKEHINSGKITVVQKCFRILKALLHEDKLIINKLKRLIGYENTAKFLAWLEIEME